MEDQDMEVLFIFSFFWLKILKFLSFRIRLLLLKIKIEKYPTTKKEKKFLSRKKKAGTEKRRTSNK